jgi:hypothetical protein
LSAALAGSKFVLPGAPIRFPHSKPIHTVITAQKNPPF